MAEYFVFEIGAFAGRYIKQDHSNCLEIIPASIVIFLMQRVRILGMWIPIDRLSYGMQGICFGFAYIGSIAGGIAAGKVIQKTR